MKRKGRGYYDYNSSDVIAVKWHANKCVTLLSNAVGVEPESSVKRYDCDEKSRVDIPCPSIVMAYNKHMGGIDLSDMLVSLYKTPMIVSRQLVVVIPTRTIQQLLEVRKVQEVLEVRKILEAKEDQLQPPKEEKQETTVAHKVCYNNC
ncbi:hypothetical protein Pcinc_017659 [Petrolisthes cinctipes]|uniref:PiggyBac transposable element-derived protein domain-containing protein n=1 Tax=Petrolisthes cinctipes TaxID=88211 RepID=A0AAE1FPM5_PETCI|nr:hypothetical protein Pcinc_017659 [Petrolisthes cinctipes]